MLLEISRLVNHRCQGRSSFVVREDMVDRFNANRCLDLIDPQRRWVKPRQSRSDSLLELYYLWHFSLLGSAFSPQSNLPIKTHLHLLRSSAEMVLPAAIIPNNKTYKYFSPKDEVDPTEEIGAL
eukprot:scaffold179323_cov43-Cyclotella_meneghiniana.AAC.1